MDKLIPGGRTQDVSLHHKASRGLLHVSHENACEVMNQLGCSGRSKTEDCDLAYSIEETPCKRDIVGEIRKVARHAGSRLRSTSLIRIGTTQTFGPIVTTRPRCPPLRNASTLKTRKGAWEITTSKR